MQNTIYSPNKGCDHMDEFRFSEIIDDLIELLLTQGCATEGDFIQIYSIQFHGAMDFLNDMLHTHGYTGTVLPIGNVYSGMAVYGIFDPEIIDYSDAKRYLDIEGKRQENGW